MFKLIMVGGLGAAAFVAYKLWKSGKAVTGRNVVSGVEDLAKKASVAVKTKLKK